MGPLHALQPILGEFVAFYTEWLFASKTGKAASPAPTSSFIDLLDSFELEDLVLLYLQEEGWRILLSSHSRSTPRYECTLLHPEAGTAGIQVKHKPIRLDAGNYADDSQFGTVFLFLASGDYGKNRPSNVRIIDPASLVAFARKRKTMLPTNLRLWFDLSEEGQKPNPGMSFE